MTAAESVTILRSRGRRLAKTIHADGSITPWDEAKIFDLIEVPIADLAALERLLRRLERRPDCCVVRGKPADPERVCGVRRLLTPDRETGDQPTLVEVPRRWVPLDIDHLALPDWIEQADLLGCAVVVIRKLAVEFQKAAFVVQATASHGLKPGIRVRLWCWLSRAVTGAELKYWLRKAPVDARVFGANQVIYTSSPVFRRGAFDPLPIRLDLVPGDETVPVPPPARLKPRKRPVPPSDRERRGDISGLIHFVQNAGIGNRSNALYWAGCRITENPDIDRSAAAHDLERAAIIAGLSVNEAAATVRSACRRGGGNA
jgi:hypothetical protein